ncbi:hypothetical protein Acr_23g0005400 [Actinidia rufa]|uniref:Uncharacterized protein n=1 Tax=Actinidia rufa TaxID=165716 RepID=A0A7J0GMY0_9ERIC|nr:hypothetical protein Acr_23g0005400 [Actinidia rufa]
MDLWIALAAAGGSYVSKLWQKNLRDRERSSEFQSGDSEFVKPESPPSMGHLHDKQCPLRRLRQRKRLGDDIVTESEQASRSASTSDVASTSGFDGEKLVNLGNSDTCNVLSISSFSPVYLGNEGQIVNDHMVMNCDDSFPEPSTTEMGTAQSFTRNRIYLRSRQSNMQFIKPRTSLESCLMAQLHKEHAGIDEYVLSSFPLPASPTVKPFFVIDGRRIISRGGDSFSLPIETEKNNLPKQNCSAENESSFGVPPMPYVESSELPRIKVKTGKGLDRKLNSSSKVVHGKHFPSLAGSSHGALLFGLGISIGLISSFLANKREVDKLNDLLKQTENLVQDLQDELEMKDSLTVKELAIEDYGSQDTCYRSYNKSAPHSSSSQQNLDRLTTYDVKELPDGKADEDSASMSKIEAELEAELERLELNMNSSTLEGSLSDLVEESLSRLPLLSEKRNFAFLARKRDPKRKNRAPKEDGSLLEQIGHKSNTPKPNRTKSSLVDVKLRQIENQSELWRAVEVRRSQSGGHRRSAMSDRRPRLWFKDHQRSGCKGGLRQNFIPDITKGELRPDIFGSQADAQPYADRDGSGTSTPHSANYAVSPRELSLRLHQVMQSRLEERVKELETALENSQRRVRFMVSEHKTSLRGFSDIELRPLTYQNAIEDQPVVINLSGEGLDAYNEAYDELMKINESKEADLTSGSNKNTLSLFDQSAYQGQNGKASPALISHEVRTLDEHILSRDVCFSGDESDDGHDEVEKLLIKQIVEKTRKGNSSVILNAEKGLFSVDEHEH